MKDKWNDNYYEDFFTNNPSIMVLLDIGSKQLIDANKASCEYYGYSLEEMKEQRFTDIIVADPDAIENALNEARFRINNSFKAINRLKSGEIRDVEIHAVPMEINGLQVLYLIVYDITESILNRQLIEEQYKRVERQNEKLEAIIENTSNGVLIFDSRGEYITFNKYARDFYINYFPQFKTVGDAFKTADHFDIEGRLIHYMDSPGARVMRGEKVADYIVRFREGHKNIYMKVNGAPVYDDKGDFLLGILSIQDVTEQIRMNDLLKAQKDQLQAIIDNMSDGLAIYNKSGKIIMYNEAAMDFLSFTNEKIKDSAFREPFICKDMFGKVLSYDEMPISRALLGEKIVQKRLMFESVTEKVYLDVSATPVYNRSKLSMIILNVRNVTQNVMYNELLLNQQKILLEAERKEKFILEEAMEIKDNFVMLITHEFKTPISIINAAIQTMELVCASELSDKALSYLNKIRQNSLRQLRLVENLLQVSSIQAGHQKISERTVEIVALTKAIIDSVNVYALRKNIQLSFKTHNKSVPVSIDDEKYERILLNLLSNAIKFTPPGKRITVSLSCKEDAFKLEVKDEGIGIPTDKQRIIFQRFGQVDSTLSRQAEGTGLGLYLVKSMVSSLGGSMTLKSTEGKGATFSVVLPSHKERIDQCELKSDHMLESRIDEAASVEFSDVYLKKQIRNSRNSTVE